MDKNQKKRLARALLLGLPMVCVSSVHAAKPIDLSNQSISALQSIISAPGAAASSMSGLQEISRSVDVNQTAHVRVQQTYAGYPVWGADAVIHIPQGVKANHSIPGLLSAAKANDGDMNGTVYQNINVDLAKTPAIVFSKSQSDTALQHAVSAYQQKIGGQPSLKDQQSNLIVYIDNSNKAHWAYKVTFFVEPAKAGAMPERPVYIMDAVSFQVYQQWNDVKTLEQTSVEGGGFGGNKKMGKMVYDALSGHLPKLKVTRDAAANKCYWNNSIVTVKNYQTGRVMSFDCSAPDPEHNNTYWIGEMDAVNDGYSPSDDALFSGEVIRDMYQDWYGLPVLTEDGKPMMLTMVVHDPIDNAYWDGRQMTFGDGVSMFYPLTSLGVAAHEISHGFTEQHSGLAYYGQSGGMNEAFSDMAAQAAEFYAYHGLEGWKNNWQIGPEIFKEENEALRYMDMPSKDCQGKEPGDWCSIDNAKEYYSGLDVHFSSGVYNRAYYLLATSEGWDAKKAFDVMVDANMHYWTSTSTFEQGACGVIKATKVRALKDAGYRVDDVVKAFATVGVDTSKC